MPDTRIRFVVTVGTDGMVKVDPTIPEEMKDAIEREANIIDIIDASRKLVSDLERQMVLDGISAVLTALTPEPMPTVTDTVKEALKERGITPAE
jgi:hypothetical protein